jgi:hypothetical protein
MITPEAHPSSTINGTSSNEVDGGDTSAADGQIVLVGRDSTNRKRQGS